MNKHVIITIRYSIYSPAMRSSWVVGRGTEQGYIRNLFSAQRLARRQKYFENITLRSLVGLYRRKPTDVKMKVILITSTMMPASAMQGLREVVSKHDFVDVLELCPESTDLRAGLVDYVNSIESNDIFASVRLDDDDGLAVTFLDQLDNYLKPEFNGFLVSFAKGHGALVDGEGRVSKLANYKWRFGSAGLTYISSKDTAIKTGRYSVYQCGNHIKTDDQYPTVSDGRHAAFVRCFHADNDSRDQFETSVSRVLLDEGEINNKLEVYSLE